MGRKKNTTQSQRNAGILGKIVNVLTDPRSVRKLNVLTRRGVAHHTTNLFEAQDRLHRKKNGRGRPPQALLRQSKTVRIIAYCCGRNPERQMKPLSAAIDT